MAGSRVPWRRHRHGLDPLVRTPPVTDLPEPRLSGGARYLDTTLASATAAAEAGTRVSDRGLSGQGSCRLSLSDEALDVVRLAGSFRIPAAAVRGGRDDDRGPGAFAVVWQHGEHRLATRFELTEPAARPWVRALAKIAKENA